MQIKKQSRQQCRPEFEIGQQIFHCGGSRLGKNVIRIKKKTAVSIKAITEGRNPLRIPCTASEELNFWRERATMATRMKDGRLTLKVATKEPSRACQNSGPQTLAPTYVAVLTAIGPGVI